MLAIFFAFPVRINGKNALIAYMFPITLISALRTTSILRSSSCPWNSVGSRCHESERNAPFTIKWSSVPPVMFEVRDAASMRLLLSSKSPCTNRTLEILSESSLAWTDSSERTIPITVFDFSWLSWRSHSYYDRVLLALCCPTFTDYISNGIDIHRALEMLQQSRMKTC